MVMLALLNKMLKICVLFQILKFSSSKSKRIPGTCQNNPQLSCHKKKDCPRYCDQTSKNAGSTCTTNRDCKKGKCRRYDCVIPTGFCINDYRKCTRTKDCATCSDKSKNSGSACKKNKQCIGGKCRLYSQKCELPTGFCKDGTKVCTSKYDCPGSCSEESNNAGASCTKDWQCHKKKLCIFQQCVTDAIKRTYDPMSITDKLSSMNPERGFYVQHSYYSSSPELLTSDMLQAIKKEKLTLLLRLYYLDTFITSPTLSNVFLEHLRSDLKMIRLNGLKVILRFAYSNSQYDNPLDANKTTIISHISQITPILSQEQDVIMIVQAGFIGAWGEWAYSDYFGNPDRNQAPDWQSRTEIVQALINNLPSHMIIQLRTPSIKMNIVDSIQPLNETIAHDGSLIARTGHHNDCFLASDSDYGTYLDKSLEYPYLEADCRYTAMGGETCNHNPPRSDCATALEEMEMFSWSYLNVEYEPNVLASWDENNGNCINEIHTRLGYQLELKEATFSKKLSNNVNGATHFSFELKIENNGFAAPINPHLVQIVLRNVDSSRVCAANAPSAEVRDWFGGSIVTLSGNAYLPVDMPLGTYEVLLHVTDLALRNKIDYKIKFANDFLNEKGTGFVKLLHVFDLEDTVTYTGDDDDWNVVCNVENEIVPPSTVNPIGSTYVVNGGFEDSTIDADWGKYSSGYEISKTESYTGLQSIAVSNGAGRQVVTLNANAGSIITLCGYSKSIGASTNLGSDYSIYADVELDSGYLWGQTANFPGGSNNWSYAEFSFVVNEHATKLTLYTMYRNDPANGLAYFDDVQVKINGSAPVLCPLGYYEPESNQGECHWCPAGYACREEKTECSDGYFSTGGAESCELCPDCNGHGVCSSVSGICICDAGWIGAYCEYT